MYPSIDKIKAILLKENYISEEDSKAAEATAQTGAEYVGQLIRAELLNKSLLGQALAEYYKLPFVDLGTNPVGKEEIGKVPEDIAREQRIVFVKASDQVVALATDSPEQIKAEKVTPLFPGKKVRLTYTLPEYIDEAFDEYAQPLATRFSQIIEKSQRVAPDIVDEIIKDALGFNASDIHFEPRNKEVTVRFRVDGLLREAGAIPAEYYDNVLNRIKVESGMRIDEHFAPQDGSMQRRMDALSVDLRVSLIPTVEGEKVVMRVLSSYVQGFTFAGIGLETNHHKILEQNMAKPFGMILTVGPTGSGKTTTLYSLIKLLNKPDVNITTIEDPVEYKLSGTNQIQVREASNITFAKGLRSIVRQDPDIILVGEIRDQETAEISVNAALTGHLLFSTFHANDAATAMPRLIDMGVEPFLLASTLELIIAQRLVRQICSRCRYSLPLGEAVKDIPLGNFDLGKYFNKSDNVYAGKGCNVCSGSGYKGRTAVFEMIEMTQEMQELMLHSPSTPEIQQLARRQGNAPMFEDGIAKVRRGVTTLSEVLRVVTPPEAEAPARA